MDAAAASFVNIATQFGFTVSFGKTKCMVVNADPSGRMLDVGR